MLNRDLLDQAGDTWSDDAIRVRTERLAAAVIAVWAVPHGHKSGAARDVERPRRKIDVADLLGAGLLEEGTTLYARRRKVGHRTATVLPDGALDVDGVRHASPSGAARALTGTAVNGWWFWLVDPKSRRCLSDLWREYVEQRGVDADDSDAPDDIDDTDDD